MNVQRPDVLKALDVLGCRSKAAQNGLIASFSKMEDMLNKAGVQDHALWWKHSLAQGAHESMLFSRLTENMWYSAERMMQVWPRYFPTMKEARKYSGNPEALANRVYGIQNPRLAKKLGNVKKGDGWKFIARGYIGLTGRYNYTQAGKDLGLPLAVEPQLVQETPIAWQTLTWYMTKPHVLKAIVADDVVKVSKSVNGGTNGLHERKLFTQRIAHIFGDAEYDPPTVRLGSVSQHVKELQQLLWNNEYACGAIDGHFGYNTYKAVKAFQKDHNLVVDGIVGDKTWKALKQGQSK